VSLYKLSNDLDDVIGRGAALPRSTADLQQGSSIMPGKVNPVVPEAVCQVVAQVVGNDARLHSVVPQATSSST